jgi:hypothetical protein
VEVVRRDTTGREWGSDLDLDLDLDFDLSFQQSSDDCSRGTLYHSQYLVSHSSEMASVLQKISDKFTNPNPTAITIETETSDEAKHDNMGQTKYSVNGNGLANGLANGHANGDGHGHGHVAGHHGEQCARPHPQVSFADTGEYEYSV